MVRDTTWALAMMTMTMSASEAEVTTHKRENFRNGKPRAICSMVERAAPQLAGTSGSF